MPPKNFKITVEYDGTDFCGWQRQKNDPTVQAAIEKALRTITGQKVAIVGSGRTDSGVHALGQVASFTCETRLGRSEMQNGLNALLPDTIVIDNCDIVDPSFHARFSAKSKTYRYRILNRPLPSAIDRRYSWHISRSLDLKSMRAAIDCIIGTHDFSAFEGAGSPRTHSRRTVMRAEVTQQGDMVLLEYKADGFLRHMVRNITGTLVAVGLGRIPIDEFQSILQSQDRARAGVTAPAQGLFLVSVQY